MLIKMLACDFCDGTFKNGRSLSSHKYSFHQQKPSKDTIAFVSDPSDQNQGKYRSSEWNKILNSSPDVSDDDSDDSSESDATIDSDEYTNSFQIKHGKQLIDMGSVCIEKNIKKIRALIQ